MPYLVIDQMVIKIAILFVRYCTALMVGVFAYFIALILSVDYTGFEMMICQPFMAAGCSLVFVLGAITLGLPLSLLRSRFHLLRSSILSLAIMAIGVILYFFSLANNPKYLFMDLKTSFVLLVIGYFLILFSIVTWPVKIKSTTSTNE
jgi:hypothetical protein